MDQGPAPSLGPTAGAQLIGIYIAIAMFGWTTFQLYRYCQMSWDSDSLWLRAYVFYVWALETVNTFMLCVYFYRAAVVNFGHPDAYSSITLSDDLKTGVTGLVMLSVHMFYIRRLWILSNRNYILAGLTTVLACAHFALIVVIVTLTIRYPSISDFHNDTSYYTSALSLAATDDVILAASLCYFLYTRRTGVRGTDNIVNRIITYSIMTGAVTSVFDLAILISFVASPDTLVYLGMFHFLPTLYVTSFLAMLNARDSLREMSANSTSGAVISTFALADFPHARGDSSANRAGEPPVLNKMSFANPRLTSTSTSDHDLNGDV